MSKRKKNVVSIEDRIPKLKQARKKKANRRLISYLSVFFLLIGIVIYLQSPLSYVKTINITGNSFLTDEDVIELSDIIETTNIWTVNKKKIEQNVVENEVIKSAEVKRVFPQTIDININEYKHIGYIKEEEDYYPIVGEGRIITSNVKAVDGDAPLLVGFDQEEYLERMSIELNEVSDNILNLISEIHWLPTKDNDNQVMLYMNDGNIVNGTIRNFSDKMEVYPSIVAQLDPGNKGVIHLGVGAYFEEFSDDTLTDKP